MQYLDNIVFHDSEESVWFFFCTFVIKKAVTVQLFFSSLFHEMEKWSVKTAVLW